MRLVLYVGIEVVPVASSRPWMNGTIEELNKCFESILTHMLPKDFTIAVDRLPLVTGKIHFIRRVDSRGKISVLNEYFDVGKEYTGEYVWATIETMKQTLMVYYKDENLVVRVIKKFGYEIGEAVHNRKNSIFGSGL